MPRKKKDVSSDQGETGRGKTDGSARTQFQPGQSGNPSGRPKDVHALREMIRAKGESLVTVLALIAIKKEEKSADRIRAAEVLLSYGFGKPAVSVELSGPDGAPVPLADKTDPVDVTGMTSEQKTSRILGLLERVVGAIPAGAAESPASEKEDAPGAKPGGR